MIVTLSRSLCVVALLLLPPSVAAAWTTPDEAFGELGRDFDSLARCTEAARETDLPASCIELARRIDAKLHRLQRAYMHDDRVARLAVGASVGLVDPEYLAAVLAEPFTCDDASPLQFDCAQRTLEEMLATPPDRSRGLAAIAIDEAYVDLVSGSVTIGDFADARKYIREFADRSGSDRAAIDMENAAVCGLARAGHGIEAALRLERLRRDYGSTSALPGHVCVEGADRAFVAAQAAFEACGGDNECRESYADNLHAIAATVTRPAAVPAEVLAALAQPFLERDRREDNSDREAAKRSRVIELHADTARDLATGDPERAAATLKAGMAVALGGKDPSAVWRAIGAAAVENRRSFIALQDPIDKTTAAVSDLVTLAEAAWFVSGFAKSSRALLEEAVQAAGEEAGALVVIAAVAAGMSFEDLARKSFERAVAFTREDDVIMRERLCSEMRAWHMDDCGVSVIERPACRQTRNPVAETLFHLRAGNLGAAKESVQCPLLIGEFTLNSDDDEHWRPAADIWRHDWNAREASWGDRQLAWALEKLLLEIGHGSAAPEGALLAALREPVRAVKNHDVRIGLLTALSRQQDEAGHTVAAAETMAAATALIDEQYRTGFASAGFVHYDDDEQIAFAIRNQASVVRVLALRYRR